jgi:hypothetical protein
MKIYQPKDLLNDLGIAHTSHHENLVSEILAIILVRLQTGIAIETPSGRLESIDKNTFSFTATKSEEAILDSLSDCKTVRLPL